MRSSHLNPMGDDKEGESGAVGQEGRGSRPQGPLAKVHPPRKISAPCWTLTFITQHGSQPAGRVRARVLGDSFWGHSCAHRSASCLWLGGAEGPQPLWWVQRSTVHSPARWSWRGTRHPAPTQSSPRQKLPLGLEPPGLGEGRGVAWCRAWFGIAALCFLQ